LKFQAPESLISVNGAFCLVEKKKKREGGEKEKAPGRLSLAHKVYSKVGPTVRDAMHMSQVYTFISL
jgi:hypothetical protein